MAESTTEFETLREELAHFRAEKEKIRDVIGQIGGQGSRKHEHVLNAVFLTLVLVLFAVEVINMAGWHLFPPAMLLSMAVLLVSVKIVWMIHRQAKVDHFQFWVLNSIDFQMNMMSRRLTSLEEKVTQTGQDTPGESAPTIRT